MPELPEVETIKRQLIDKIVGLTIKNILINKPKLFVGDPKIIIGLKVQGVRRRAKMIVIDLENDWNLLIHLKMSGQLVFGGVPNKFTHITFEFSNGSKLYYNDMRQFGWVKEVKSKELEQELDKFGPEPLDKDFSIEKLKTNLLKHKNLRIKPTLMDQSVIAGLGNIYAAEVCFQAGIRPDRKISTLGDEDLKKLYQAIKKILPLAIKYKGTSADSYVTLEGKKGNYESKLWVYGREGQKCPNNCGSTVKKINLGGRGTYFCPACQK